MEKEGGLRIAFTEHHRRRCYLLIETLSESERIKNGASAEPCSNTGTYFGKLGSGFVEVDSDVLVVLELL